MFLNTRRPKTAEHRDATHESSDEAQKMRHMMRHAADAPASDLLFIVMPRDGAPPAEARDAAAQIFILRAICVRQGAASQSARTHAASMPFTISTHAGFALRSLRAVTLEQ